ncbi:MAG TPA: efflux RND transporter periplasmic adaptor subunit, partial [Candidatus Binatia bacterium]|nr:efflux RND transporter periplasmic adaptor subunit [Candidatus Binatia bacterium]
VELTLDAAPGRVFKGTLTWVSAQVDERTRMARALAEVPNPDGSLRAQSFARARIVTAPAGDALTVPRSAIQQVEGRSFAFIKHADDLYEARAVRVGASDPTHVSVAGIAANDDVVVEHSFLVKSQLQISRLGAGCTD